jgi:hypothetical protein
MSRASVESSKNKKRTRSETTIIQVEANPSGSSEADVTVEASLRSVGEVLFNRRPRHFRTFSGYGRGNSFSCGFCSEHFLSPTEKNDR